MEQIILTCNDIEATVNYHGAELKSLKKGEREYLWQADPTYWNRTSPVLFPFVGQVSEGVYRHNGSEYKMGQHGFARDMDFDLVNKTENTCIFILKSNEETKKKYPFDFELCIGYELSSTGIKVIWNVKNSGEEKLEFSIGAHPAFNCILDDTSIRISKDGKAIGGFTNSVFGKGLLTENKKDIALDAGVMKLSADSFDGDAYVIENNQTDKVEMLDKDGNTYLAVSFDSPLVGIWSPPGKNAPFLCIEPWYGRCDKEGYSGELKDREWNNTLGVNEEFKASYSIEV